MNEDRAQVPDSLRAKFPHLRPVNRVPVLWTVNGIGLTLFGKRDLDAETGTYVKTHCFCFFYIPLVAIGAYRVADADRGWYFLGKDRLSSFAASFNVGVLLLSLMFAGIIAQHAYTTSPSYLAQQKLKHAAAALQTGDAPQAAILYRQVAEGPARNEEGKHGLRLALEACLTNAAPDKVAAGFRLLAGLPRDFNSPTPLVPGAYQRGLEAVGRFRTNNPDGALGILRQVTAFAPTNSSIRPLEIDLLKAAIASKPDATNRVVELALIYEEQKQLPDCYRLLTPYQKRLGATEGARILGQHLLEGGQMEDAYGLLFPYVSERLDKLHAVERNYTNAFAKAYHQAIEHLRRGEADRSFYDNYDKASKAEKETLVEAFAEKWMRQDAAFRRAANELSAANQIVHVTLDLGIVQLNRAQALTDPGARKGELQAAEKTFLAIRGLAGNTDEYRMFLGQVYYWLGKAKDGQDLFEQLLAAHKRDYSILLNLGHTLREVGEETRARQLVEEAYLTAKKDKDKFQAASLRAQIQKDLDDHIAWLEKADPNEPTVVVNLNTARGEKALRDGNREEAARFVKKAITGYESLPQTSANLNNCGLAYLALYDVTGDIADHNRGLALLEQAVSLNPGNSVLLVNITHLLATRACMDVVGDAIHFGALKETPGREMLWHLYRDEAERVKVMQQLRQNEHLKKMLTYMEKGMLLAPKSPMLYNLSLQFQQGLRDEGELSKLQQRLLQAAPDLAETRQQTLDVYHGTRDKQYLARSQSALRRYEALVELPEVKAHPLTLEFAETQLDGLRQTAAYYGAPLDCRKLLANALATHQRQPTAASLHTLIAASFFQANKQLKQQSAEYAALEAKTRRALSPEHLIACLLERGGALSELIRKDTSVTQALARVKEMGRAFPSSRPMEDWALFRTLDAGEAASVAAALKADRAGRLADEIQFQLNPLSGTAVLEQYWVRKSNGDLAGAAQLYQEALKNGVPLPPL